ncbi:ABC transporter transmembrane domain-containing protein, partial [Aphanothece microscopica]|uniref:ABC transporter transmembrane domain-containing protein n=1 Tax=Aphanothece microscopica TaxID=1049561 RepID=UPI003CE4B469
MIRIALRQNLGLLTGVGIFSGVINILALTGAMYMLQVYDRVIPSRSIPTLVALTVLLVVLFAANGLLDVFRSRIMSRIAIRLDEALRTPLFDAVQTLALQSRSDAEGLLAIRDLDRLRSFLSGAGPASLFDLPWIPVYLFIIFLLHPLLGWFSLAGAALLIAVTLATEMLSRGPSLHASASGSQRLALAGVAGRNAEVVRAMGLGPVLSARWNGLSERHLVDQIRASDAVGGMSVVSKSLRLLMQSGILGLGAFLAVRGEVSAGVIIAGSIVMSRALAPIETVIQHWRGFVDARQAAGRLNALLGLIEAGTRPVTDLPAPHLTLRVETLSLAHPGQTQLTLQGIDLALGAGEGLG